MLADWQTRGRGTDRTNLGFALYLMNSPSMSLHGKAPRNQQGGPQKRNNQKHDPSGQRLYNSKLATSPVRTLLVRTSKKVPLKHKPGDAVFHLTLLGTHGTKKVRFQKCHRLPACAAAGIGSNRGRGPVEGRVVVALPQDHVRAGPGLAHGSLTARSGLGWGVSTGELRTSGATPRGRMEVRKVARWNSPQTSSAR